MRDARCLKILRLSHRFVRSIWDLFFTQSHHALSERVLISLLIYLASIKRVGVFVNESNAVIIAKSKSLKLDLVQLHGNESPAKCDELKATGLGVIKVFSIDDDFNFELTKPYREVVDYFLFDTKGKYYGGNAKTFNWEILEQIRSGNSIFLKWWFVARKCEYIG